MLPLINMQVRWCRTGAEHENTILPIKKNHLENTANQITQSD